MKSNKTVGLVLVLVISVFSCSKDKTITTQADANGTLLAGAKGSSKKWSIATIAETKNGASVGTISSTDSSFPVCESDNVFQFSNNTTQDYIVTEGTTNCNPGTDPSTIEKGSWAFTNDGKTLLIDGQVFPTSTQFQDTTNEPFLGYMILAEGLPLKVIQLTDATLSVSYHFTSGADSYVVTLTFTKA